MLMGAGLTQVSGSVKAQVPAPDKAIKPACAGRACAEEGHGVYISRSSGLPVFRAEDRFGGDEVAIAFVRPINRAHLAERPEDDIRGEFDTVGLFDAHSGKRIGTVAHDGTPPFGKRYLVQRHQITWMSVDAEGRVEGQTAPAPLGRAVFASRCAWSHEGQLGQLRGVKVTSKGYHRSQARSLSASPSDADDTLRCVEVIYDPAVVTYSDVADRFLKLEEARRNGAVSSDRPVLFVSDAEQTRAAQALKERTSMRREAEPSAHGTSPAPSAWWAEVRAAGDFESVSSLHAPGDDGRCPTNTTN